MSKFSLSEMENLPETAGVFCFLNEKSKNVFVGVGENLTQEIPCILAEKDFLRNEVKQIETLNSGKKNLPNVFAENIRLRKPLYNFSLNEQRHFPHFKITNEKFPRLLVTRKIENDGADLQNQNEKQEPLIVPIRFDDENGDARDLQPIAARNLR